MVKSDGHLSNHELCLIFFKAANSNQMSEKLSTFDKVHNKEYSVLILENIGHTDKKIVLYVDENILFKV